MGSIQRIPASFTLPQLARDHAVNVPNKTFVTVPNSPDLKQGWRNITFGQFAQAVDGAAHWMEKNIRLQGNGQVITYLGVNDVRYAVVMVATMKAGCKIMLPSLRNSLEGQLSLLDNTHSTDILYSESVETIVDPIKASRPKSTYFQVPSYDDFIRIGANAGKYPMYGSIAEDEQVLILNTSGSTGLPKPVYITNGSIATIGNLESQPTPPGRKNVVSLWTSTGPFFTMMPFFHAMGCALIFKGLIWASPLIFLPVGRPVTAELLIEVFNEMKPEQSVMAPSMIEELSNSPEGLDALAQSQHIYFGGAPLAREAGDRVLQRTNLIDFLGSTEALFVSILLLEDPKDWQYFEWTPNSGAVLEPAGDNLYELVLKRQETRAYQAVFNTFPDLDEWRTKDLFEQHPLKAGLWRFAGRRDDIIVLSNGEKFNPVDLEKQVENDPLVHGALAVGQGRFQAGLVIEPRWDKLDDTVQADEILDLVYPAVERANKEMPSHGRVWRSKIAIAGRDKAFKRAPKGSIIRRATKELFEPEIDALYLKEGFDEVLGKLDNKSDLDTVKTFIRKACQMTMPNISDEVADEADFFAFGVDSLQVMALSSALNYALSNDSTSSIGPKDIYQHPSIQSVAEFITNGQAGSNLDGAESTSDRESIIANMVSAFTDDLPINSGLPQINVKKHTVILTGSTGSLGNYVLQQLTASDDVAAVYCLNRSDNAERRQRESFENRGAIAEFSKVTFLQAQFGENHFGLEEAVYEALLSKVDIVIHNAWAVDFNKSLQSYKDVHLKGLRHFVDFSLQSVHRAQVVFISSIASVGAWTLQHKPDEFVPEKFTDSSAVTLPQGYGESKHVGERILTIAAERSGVPVTVIRCGQLAGSASDGGVWNRHEWLPSIVATSKAMGMVPQTLGNQDVVDWVPTDQAASIVWDLALSRAAEISNKQQLTGIYHIVNPQTSTWADLVPALQSHFGQIEEVTFDHWVTELAKTPLTATEAEKKPGIKLLDFYQGLSSSTTGLPRLATDVTVQNSEAMRSLTAVDEALMARWLEQWQF